MTLDWNSRWALCWTADICQWGFLMNAVCMMDFWIPMDCHQIGESVRFPLSLHQISNREKPCSGKAVSGPSSLNLRWFPFSVSVEFDRAVEQWEPGAQLAWKSGPETQRPAVPEWRSTEVHRAVQLWKGDLIHSDTIWWYDIYICIYTYKYHIYIYVYTHINIIYIYT